MSVINWEVSTFFVVTGASRGLGRTLAIEFCKKLTNPDSAVLLIARDKIQLEKTKEEIVKLGTVTPNIETIDLALLDSPSYEHLLLKRGHKHYQQVVLIHNAGTLGDVSKTAVNCTSSSEVKEYFNLNLHSAMFLTSAFLKVFESSERKLIINITSLAAKKPFQGWSLYCTGKAARDMYFRVLAEEEHSVLVLNYAPGPLLTDMLSQIMQQALPEIRQQFQEAQAQNQLLTCEYTVQHLIEVLERSRFKSGDHVDVFDTNY